MKKSTLLRQFKDATADLLRTIEKIPGEQFNTTPQQGGWSPGQVVEHLIKVETGTLRLFSGPVKEADRNPEEHLPEIRERFLDFSWKMTAPGTIMPDDEPKDKTKALQKMQDIRQRLAGMIELHDLTELVMGFDHPIFGKLTKAEWIVFNTCHGQRHAHQIKNIVKNLGD